MADLYAYQFKTSAAEKWYNDALKTVETIASSGDEQLDPKLIKEYRGRLLDHIGKIKVRVFIFDCLFLVAKCYYIRGFVRLSIRRSVRRSVSRFFLNCGNRQI